MKIFSANIESLDQLYNSELRKALDLEEQIVKALPTMIEKSADPQLKQAFQVHLQESEKHLDQVKHILDQLPESGSQTCKVIHALVAEAQDAVKDVNDKDVLDIALIGAGQQVEHHEIAVYGTLRVWAGLLGKGEDQAILDGILNDEKHADKVLSEVAERVYSEASVVTR